MVVGRILKENEELQEDCIEKMRNSLIWITVEIESIFLFFILFIS